jgi:dTDP-4-amino-4,6-dideoxygalactose transaminase
VPPHISDAYDDLRYNPGCFPITEELANTVISVPIGPHLSIEAAEQVINCLRAFKL